MKLLPTQKDHLSAIMLIIAQAQRYLASLGIDQWQDGYPNEEAILHDVLNGESFIVKNDNGHIMGTTMFTLRPEPTYEFIEGEWLTDSNAQYGVIHRMAVSDDFRKSGVAQFVFKQCEQTLKEKKFASMRIDTHEENKGMQSLLKKLEYTYCGVIYLKNGDKRLAFEKRV